jgi:hypothetical protein
MPATAETQMNQQRRGGDLRDRERLVRCSYGQHLLIIGFSDGQVNPNHSTSTLSPVIVIMSGGPPGRIIL